MKSIVLAAALAASLAPQLSAATLPGFRIEKIATPSGFCNSLAVDSRGTIYYTTTAGGIFRLDANAASTKIAQVPTQFIGNAGLLGMALFDDNTAAVHYTTPGPTHEVISKVDLKSGAETVMATIPDDTSAPGHTVPSEHHGGTPAIGDNGSVYVGIGDFGTFLIASKPDWYAGKILRIDPDGRVTIVASGFRNPYGIAWDAANKRVIAPDNGDIADDEINIVTSAGGFFGWPFTMGTAAPYPDAVPPVYVFPKIIAPTGLAASSRNTYTRGGYLLGGFVSKAIYYIANVDAQPFPDPIAITAGELPPVIGVAEGPDGGVWFASSTAIYRLNFPLRGDCNGDGLVDRSDLDALNLEIGDGDPHPATSAQDGAYRGAWGCDVNGDGVISASDRDALAAMVHPRMRAVRF